MAKSAIRLLSPLVVDPWPETALSIPRSRFLVEIMECDAPEFAITTILTWWTNFDHLNTNIRTIISALHQVKVAQSRYWLRSPVRSRLSDPEQGRQAHPHWPLTCCFMLPPSFHPTQIWHILWLWGAYLKGRRHFIRHLPSSSHATAHTHAITRQAMDGSKTDAITHTSSHSSVFTSQ